MFFLLLPLYFFTFEHSLFFLLFPIFLLWSYLRFSYHWIEWFLFFWLLVLIYFLGFLLILLFPFFLLYILLFLFSFIYWSSLIPYPLYLGSILTIISIDNGNIGFILLSIILFPLIDWIAGFESKTMNISFLLFYLFFVLILCFLLISLLLFFICYECLILLLFFILFLFIPTYYRIRTAFFYLLIFSKAHLKS